jgi:tetratricopeptide (TPR) repeat protein
MRACKAGFRAATAAFLAAYLCAPVPAMGQESPGDAVLERRALDHAARLEQAGRPDEAMRVLESLLQEQPRAVSALALLAQTAERAGDPGRALPWAEAAVRQDRSGLPAVWQLWIRVLEAAGLGDSALNAASRWVEEDPLEPSSHAALSGLWARGGDLDDAIAVLEQARSTVGSNRLFVQELALLHAEVGSWYEAAVEWRAMLGWGAPGVEVVERHLVRFASRRSEALPALKSEIAGPEATTLERRGATQLALVLGEVGWGREVVAGLVEDLPKAGGMEVLRDYVTRARNSGDLAGAAWAARSLADQSRTRDEALYWMASSSDLSYEAGDRESARISFERLIEEAKPGSDLYELALRRLHEMSVEEDPDRAEELLEEHHALYPEHRLASIEMAVSSAQAWLRRGDLGRARSAMELVSPADVEQAILQAGVLGRLEILEGRPEAARPYLELASAVPAGRPGTRIDALELLTLVEEADPAGLVVMASGLGETAESGDAGALLESVSRWSLEGTAGGERMAAFVAEQLKAAGMHSAARRVWFGIVEGWPESPAAPRALLDLARADAAEDPARALVWLERLIVDYPESAMAPVARQFLSELRAGTVEPVA